MAPQRDQEAPGRTEDSASRPLCIVIADDDRDAVLTLEMLLRDEGNEVHGVYDAQQALDAVLRFGPDAVILDIALGSGSGFDVARQIRARHGDRAPMIIGISGKYKKGSDRVLGAINGMNHFLVKPYDPNDVLRLLAPLRQSSHWTPVSEPRQQEETYRAAIVRAAALVGSARELGDRLQVSMPDLTQWVVGEAKPPLDVFLRVVDILLTERQVPGAGANSGAIVEFPKPPDINT